MRSHVCLYLLLDYVNRNLRWCVQHRSDALIIAATICFKVRAIALASRLRYEREMDSLCDANEHLLTELGKLASELSHLDSDKTSENNLDIMEDVSSFVNEVFYHRQTV